MLTRYLVTLCRLSVMRGVPVALVLLLASCATTTLTGEWRDDTYAGPMTKVLVIGMSANTVFRRVYEERLAARLEERGVTAVAGADVLAEGTEASQERIREAIEGKGFDAVLVTRLIDIETQKTIISQTDYLLPPPYYRNFYDYYYRVHPQVYRRDYLVTDTIVTLETAVYESTENRLIWVVTSESFNPQRANDLADGLSKFIVDKLANDGLI